VLIWSAVGFLALYSVGLFRRRGVWDDLVAGRASIQEVDNADQMVAVLGLISAIVVVSAGIVLSIWSLRIVRNAEQFAGSGLRPGLACGGWYIPIGNLWVPFVRLRDTMRTFRGDSADISRWQAGWIAMSLGGSIERAAFDIDPFDPDSISDTLGSEAWFSVFTLVIAAVTAWFAMRALRSLGAGLTQRHDEYLGRQTDQTVA